jgi:DNA-directed RNA polymerase specialized sigma24 family protein
LKVPRRYFRAIEAELYKYSENLRELKRRLADALYCDLSTSITKVGEAFLFSDPVVRRVIERIENKKTRALAERVFAVERVLQQLEEIERSVFDLRYIQCRSHREIERQLGIAQTTFYSILHHIVCLAGIELGIIDATDLLDSVRSL